MKNSNTINQEEQRSGQSSHRRRRSERYSDPPGEQRSTPPKTKSSVNRVFRALGNVCRDVAAVLLYGLLMGLKWLWARIKLLAEQIQKKQAAEQRAHHGQRIHRRRRRRARIFIDGSEKGVNRYRKFMMAALSLLMIYSLIQIGIYVGEYISAKQVSDELRAEYYAALNEETEMPTLPPETQPPAEMPTAMY